MLMWIWTQRSSFISVGNAQQYIHLERCLISVYKANHTLPWWSRKLHSSGLYPNVLKISSHKIFPKNVYPNWIIMNKSLIIFKLWKLPRSSLVNKWINKLKNIQILKDYSAAKRNELLGHENTRKKFTCTLLRERGPSEKAAFLWSQLKGILNKRQNYGDNQMINSWQGWGDGEIWIKHEGFLEKIFAMLLQW